KDTGSKQSISQNSGPLESMITTATEMMKSNGINPPPNMPSSSELMGMINSFVSNPNIQNIFGEVASKAKNAKTPQDLVSGVAEIVSKTNFQELFSNVSGQMNSQPDNQSTQVSNQVSQANSPQVDSQDSRVDSKVDTSKEEEVQNLVHFD